MNNVVACIDGSPSALGVCDAAAWASTRLDAPLTLLHVLEKSSTPDQDNLSGAIGLGSREHLLSELTELDEKRSRLALEHGKHMLADAKDRVEKQGVVKVEEVQRHGFVLDTILEMQHATRLLVMGRMGEDHTQGQVALGSHLENVVRAASNPILVSVGEFNAPRNYMLAYDGSETANKAIERVAASPLLRGLEGHLVMVGEAESDRLEPAKLLLEQHGHSVTSCVLKGDIADALHQYQEAHRIEMLVMGAYGHSRIRQFFVGSNTSKMVTESTVPIILLR
ncbi:universal stress protein [Aurantivibrio plasticivorans]